MTDAVFRVAPGGMLSGSLRVPGDKSISHRAAILAALARGESRISGFLEAADCQATVSVLQRLGVEIERISPGQLRVQGRGGDLALPAADPALDFGNSGTGIRLMAGVLAGQRGHAVLSGDVSLRSRPMNRIIDPLTLMGAEISSHSGRAPLSISGRRPLAAISYALPVASAQVKSAILLAALSADGETVITGKTASRDHTERMLAAMSVAISREGDRLVLAGPAVPAATDIDVPGDLSSAAFFIAIAAALPGAELEVTGVGLNPTRTGSLDILREMEADIELEHTHTVAGEPVGNVRVRGSDLRGIHVGPDAVAGAIDEFPILFVCAALARGTTRVTGAQELRVKESDRIATMARGLLALGVRVEEFDDGMEIEGVGQFTGGEVDACGDHRVAMALALAGLAATGTVTVSDVENVRTSFPGFAAEASRLGLAIEASAFTAEAPRV